MTALIFATFIGVTGRVSAVATGGWPDTMRSHGAPRLPGARGPTRSTVAAGRPRRPGAPLRRTAQGTPALGLRAARPALGPNHRRSAATKRVGRPAFAPAQTTICEQVRRSTGRRSRRLPRAATSTAPGRDVACARRRRRGRVWRRHRVARHFGAAARWLFSTTGTAADRALARQLCGDPQESSPGPITNMNGLAAASIVQASRADLLPADRPPY